MGLTLSASSLLAIVATTVSVSVSALQSLPPVEFSGAGGKGSGFSVANGPRNIYIDTKWSSHKDENGLTLIPPSAFEFAETFKADLDQITGKSWKLEKVNGIPDKKSGIYLGEFRGSADNLTYEDGSKTEEGYEIEVAKGSVFIGGTGARGMWWGTRTLLQQILLADGDDLPVGHATDAPAFATRGYLLDCGRKWYSPEFLKELCTFASFFKMSEFQYHLMDNYPLNRGHNETWQDVYHQFALMPEKNKDLEHLIRAKNETLSHDEFKDLQSHCAARGVTVIPEIEAPGHSLGITKWKPQLALAKKDLLNLTHPDTFPTIKSIWEEFLPWFETKEVHIGADEYDPTLADDYLKYVNDLNKFIKGKTGKDARIWGTLEPSKDLTLDKDIIVQHWQFNQSDPVQLAADGYKVINSEDYIMYTSIKNDHEPILPARYMQWPNITRVFNFGEKKDLLWDPTMFDPYNTSDVVPVGSKGNRGAILASWNDNGVDASTQLEAFHTIRESFAFIGARAWSGAKGVKLEEKDVWKSIRILTDHAPGQNLDRRVPGELTGGKTNTKNPIFTWNRKDSKSKRAGNDDKVTIGAGAKGMNYTLTLDVTGPFTLSCNDSILSLDSKGALVFSTDNWPYPLQSTDQNDGDGSDPIHPGRIWANATSSSHKQVKVPTKSTIKIRTTFLTGSRVWVNGKFVGRFEVYVFGGKNTVFSWSQMAFSAPLETVEGGVEKITVDANDGGLDDKDNNGGDGGDDGDNNDDGDDKKDEKKKNAATSIRWNSALAGLAITVAFGRMLFY